MSPDRPPDYLVSLVHELRSLPGETEWVEFKSNLAQLQEIGEYSLQMPGNTALFVVLMAMAAGKAPHRRSAKA